MKRWILMFICICLLCGCGHGTEVNVNNQNTGMRLLNQQGKTYFDMGDGFYYVSDNGYLYFFDYQAKTNVMVCSRPDCPIAEDSESYLPTGMIFTYQDSLYSVMRDEQDATRTKSKLVKSDLDRGNQKFVAEIPTQQYTTVLLYENYALFAIDETAYEKNEQTGAMTIAPKRNCYLYQVNLDTGETRVISRKWNDYNNSLSILANNDDCIVLSYHCFEREYDGFNFEEAGAKSQYYLYHLKTEKLEEIKWEGFNAETAVSEAMLSDDGTALLALEVSETQIQVVKHNLTNGQSETVYELNEYPIITDDKWYFHDKQRNGYAVEGFDDIAACDFEIDDDIWIEADAGDYFLARSNHPDSEVQRGFILKEKLLQGDTEFIPAVDTAK